MPRRKTLLLRAAIARTTWNFSGLLQIIDDLPSTGFHIQFPGQDDDLGFFWHFVGRGNTGELADLAAPCLLIQALDIALFADGQRSITISLDAITRCQQGANPVAGEQGKLCRVIAALGEHLDGLAPRRLLGLVALARVQHMPLHHPARGGASAFHNAPVAVCFAVLETGLCA